MLKLRQISGWIDEAVLSSGPRYTTVLQQPPVAKDFTLALVNTETGHMDRALHLTSAAYFELKRRSHWIYAKMLDQELTIATGAIMGPADDCNMATLQPKLDRVKALKAEMAIYKAEKEAYLRSAQQPPADFTEAQVSAPATSAPTDPEEPSAPACAPPEAEGVPECEACHDKLLNQQAHMFCANACLDPLRSQSTTAGAINPLEMAEDVEGSSSSSGSELLQGNPLVLPVLTGAVQRCMACRKGWETLSAHMYCENACLPPPNYVEEPFFKLPPGWDPQL